MIERQVVTAFLTRGPQVLLLRRGDRVRTYRGLWAGASGTIEAGRSPIEQAIQEIEEETGLSNSEADPVLAGRPFDFVDESISRRWIVHPFRFRIAADAKVVLDWENSVAVWTEPAQLERLSTVPRLLDSWRRVAFLPQAIERSLDDLRHDHSAGAAELARQALSLLESAAHLHETDSPHDLTDLLDRTAGALRLARPTMAPIAYWSDRFESALSDINRKYPTMSALPSAVATAVLNLGIEADQLADLLATNVADSLSDANVVVTASYSSTLIKGLSRAADRGKRIRVLALESGGGSPSFGRRVSDAARAAGLPATVVPNDDLPVAVRQADLVLIGADSVLSDGSVINGTPSRLLAEAAQRASVPVIVAAGPTKRLGEDSPALAFLRTGRLEAGFDLVPARLIQVIL